MIPALTNHLWQSTLFAIAAWLLTVAFRKSRAQVRYWLWLSASFKFFIPFSLLISLGSHLGWSLAPARIVTETVSVTMAPITQSFPGALSFVAATRGPADWTRIAIFAISSTRPRLRGCLISTWYLRKTRSHQDSSLAATWLTHLPSPPTILPAPRSLPRYSSSG
jgi:hypothetical protein